MGMKKFVRAVADESFAAKAVERVSAKVAGIPYEVVRKYDQMVWDEWEEGGSFWEAANDKERPEGMLVIRHFYSAIYRRLHKLGLGDTRIARNALFLAQYWGRAYLHATRESSWSSPWKN